MVAVRAKQGVKSGPSRRVTSSSRAAPKPPAALHTLPVGAVLFDRGDARRVYRVEKGALWHYIRWADGSHDVIEFAFAGEIIGLGTLKTHVSTAQAMVETVVSVVSDDEAERLSQSDDVLALKAASASDREFDALRDCALTRARPEPLKRVANYLSALASMSAHDGCKGAIIAEDLNSGYVAEQLDMSIDALSAALLSLKAQGLVAAVPEGLRVIDAEKLERFAASA
jgi:CRP/FNR family transcriptional regulator, anaerobic regulatory protein